MANIMTKDFAQVTPTTSDLVLITQGGNTRNALLSDVRGVVDNVTSTDSNKSLSAKQGKILNDKIGVLTTDLSDMANEFKCELSANQNIGISGDNTAIFNAIIEDNSDLFSLNSSTGEITVIKAGTYSICLNLRLSGTSANGIKMFNVSIRNGASPIAIQSAMWQRDISTTANTFWFNVFATTKLNAGDKIMGIANTPEAIVYSIVKATGQTSLTVRKVG